MKRFELIRFTDAAVLVDYRSGAFFRVGGARREWETLVHSQARLAEAPHLLLAQGWFVLHASAIAEPAGVVAFCGASGAGKTTLARRKRAIAEDLVVLDGTRVIADAEPRLRAWAEARGPLRGRALFRGSRRERLAAIAFLDAGRRGGRSLRLEPLPPSEAFARLLVHSFAESGDARIWRRIVAQSRRLVLRVPCADATVPQL